MKKILSSLLLCFQCFTVFAEEGTVVGVHGMLATRRGMAPMKRALDCAGFDVCLFDFPSRERTIQIHGCNLAKFLQLLAEEKPGQPIHFVTHSIGALILRSALNDPCCPEEAKIGRAVLIAPPNKGSKLARRFKGFQPVELALGPESGWQLMHFDECSIIQCLGNFPQTMQVLVIAGNKGMHPWFKCEPNDGFLTVEETQLNTPHFFCVLPIGHGNLILCPNSLELARNFLLYGFCQP